MKIRPFSIALITAFILSCITGLMLSALDGIKLSEIAIIVLILFFLSTAIVYIILDFLIFRYLNQLISIIDDAKLSKGDSSEFYKFENLVSTLNSVLSHKDKSIEELKKLAAFRKEFIADVSHELKTPIFAAQGFVHTLIDGAVKDKAVRTKFLEKAARSLDGLDILVQDLVTLSQMEIGEVRMHKEYFDLVELSTEVIEQFEGKAEKKEVILALKKSGNEEILVFADPHRIFQVISNLVSNAINYTNEGGRVEIELIPNEKNAEIRVVDTGIGIPNEHINRIFQRFYRVDKSRSRKQGGTGLGLAIVKHIIELHKSEIKVESEVGKGTKFFFLLPTEKTSDSQPLHGNKNV